MGNSSRRRAVLAAGPLLLAVGGCTPPAYVASDPPDTIVQHWNPAPPGQPLAAAGPPDSITIRWNPARDTASDMAYVAERHCLAWDEHAEQVKVETDGGMRLSTFVCKGPLLR